MMEGNFQLTIADTVCHIHYVTDPSPEQTAMFDMVFHVDGTHSVNGYDHSSEIDISPLHRTVFSRVLEQLNFVPKKIGINIT